MCDSASTRPRQRAYDELLDSYKAAIVVAAAEQNASTLQRYDALNPPALERLRFAFRQMVEP